MLGNKNLSDVFCDRKITDNLDVRNFIGVKMRREIPIPRPGRALEGELIYYEKPCFYD